MREHFVLPSEAEGFERIHYIELDEHYSKKIVVLNNDLAEI